MDISEAVSQQTGKKGGIPMDHGIEMPSLNGNQPFTFLRLCK